MIGVLNITKYQMAGVCISINNIHETKCQGNNQGTDEIKI